MPDIINLLPDAVANQIAAGEVIQRPASAVKELLENAVDSGASSIKLIIKDSGKTLIQVIDNGCGMSVTDARMAFERHATSKIKSAQDLFEIRTLGFRGEALASIAAIAHVELKTKRVEDELGTQINIEGSKVTSQEAVQCPNGSSISIKNLFFNVPARRNFLKSNQVETRHIVEEFHRVAMVNPSISFSMHHNDKLVFQLPNSNLKQRIVGLFGNQYSQRLVPITEQSNENVKIHGFVGKPEFARKTRGEQYFFANNRFIKHPYMNHSIDSAYKELIPTDSFPTYFIYIDVDPKFIDINIHPTKTEINFQDNKLVYAVLRAVVRQSLGKHNLTPSLDFDLEKAYDFQDPKPGTQIKPPTISVNPDYNPFDKQTNLNHAVNISSGSKNWEELYEISKHETRKEIVQSEINLEISNNDGDTEIEAQHKTINEHVFQLKNQYIITNIASGLILIDQSRAHERILFEKYYEILEHNVNASQKELFPETIQFNASEADIISEIMEDLQKLGFQLEKAGKNTYVFQGRPADLKDQDIKQSIDAIIEIYQKNLLDLSIDKKINLARSTAACVAIKKGQKLQKLELNALVDELFACKIPEVTPSGEAVFKMISLEDIEKMFN